MPGGGRDREKCMARAPATVRGVTTRCAPSKRRCATTRTALGVSPIRPPSASKRSEDDGRPSFSQPRQTRGRLPRRRPSDDLITRSMAKALGARGAVCASGSRSRPRKSVASSTCRSSSTDRCARWARFASTRASSAWPTTNQGAAVRSSERKPAVGDEAANAIAARSPSSAAHRSATRRRSRALDLHSGARGTSNKGWCRTSKAIGSSKQALARAPTIRRSRATRSPSCEIRERLAGTDESGDRGVARSSVRSRRRRTWGKRASRSRTTRSTWATRARRAATRDALRSRPDPRMLRLR